MHKALAVETIKIKSNFIFLFNARCWSFCRDSI